LSVVAAVLTLSQTKQIRINIHKESIQRKEKRKKEIKKEKKDSC
jgi:hypothetical protein